MREGHGWITHGALVAALSGAVAGAVLAGCPVHEEGMEPSGDCQGPCLDIDPRHLDFETVPAGHEVVRTWTLTAVGTRAVHIHDVRLEGSASLVLDESLLTTPIEPGDQSWVRVSFQPGSEEALAGTLTIDSDDPLEPSVAIPLVGLGVAPVLELTPDGWDAGDPFVGCDQATSLQLRNAGSSPLTIESVTLSDPGGEFDEEHPFPDGVVLAPLAIQPISLFYRPLDEVPDAAELIITSDDPVLPAADVPLTGTAHFAGEAEDVFAVQGEALADLLFVVDNTETMEWYQVQLGLYSGDLVDALAGAGVDARVAVITTDDPAFIGPVLDPALPTFGGSFADAAGVGLLGDPWERGLLQARDALSPPLTDPGGPNDGLLRDTAALHLLVLSDADDHSVDDPQDYVDALAALKPGPGFVVVHAMTGQMAGCSWWYASADPADRYEAAVASTGGTSTSICTLDWEGWFDAIHWMPPHTDGTFTLSAEPVPETLEVEVDGAPATDGWSLDPYQPVIVFEPDAVPGLGAQVVVRYVVQGEC